MRRLRRAGRHLTGAFTGDGFGHPREWREALVNSDPEKFLMPTGGDLRYQWVCARMDKLEVPEMRDFVLDAWAMCVPKKVLAEYAALNPR